MLILWRILAIAVLVAVLALVLGPASGLELDPVFPGIDKLAHLAAFGLLLWSVGILLPTWPRWSLGILVVLMGGLTEILQYWTGRDPDVLDFVADAVGTLAALAAWYVWRGFRPRRAMI